MMDLGVYESLRAASFALFKNSLILPVAAAVVRESEAGEVVAIAEVREVLGGRVEGNQIREALNRLTEIGASAHIPSPRRSEPHLWRREDHPFWPFADSWVRSLEEAVRPTGK